MTKISIKIIQLPACHNLLNLHIFVLISILKMRNGFARNFLLSLFCIISTWNAAGQEKGTGLFRLGPEDLSRDTAAKDAVISASRTLKDSEDIPLTVYIISREDILLNGCITLADALKSVPGMKVSQPGSGTEGELFLMRGLLGNYYCKILIDGMPVQPSVVNGMPVSAQLPVRQAERIEVIFGPSSSVYGADALAGVINIVTHTSDRPVTAQADISMGSDAQEYLNVSIGGKAGRNRNVISYSLFGSAMNRNDMDIKDDISGVYDPSLYDTSYSYLNAPYYQGDSVAPVLGKLPEMSRLIGFSLKWRGLSLQFLNMSRRTHSSVGLATDLYSYASPRNYWGEDIRRLSFGYDYYRPGFRSLTNLSWINYRLDEESSFGMIIPVGNSNNAYKYAASDDIFLEEQLNWLPVAGLEVSGGLSCTLSGNLPKTNDLYSPFNTSQYHAFSKDPVSDSIFGSFGYYPQTFYNAGGYLQVYYRYGRFVAIAGDRYDYHSRYKGSNNPRIALQFDATARLTARASFGTGFRAPSTYYSYASLASRGPDGIYYTTVPNAGLKPEKLLAAEAGVHWRAGDRVRIDGSLFYHRLKGQFTRSFVLLDPTDYPDATNPFHLSQAYVNDDTSRAELIGLQCYVRAGDIIKAVHLSGELQLALSKGMEALPNGLGNINSYRQWPEIFGQLNFSLRPVSFLYIYLRNVFSSGWTRKYYPLNEQVLEQIGYETRTRGYYTLDIVGRLAISRNFQAFFQLNNVFDARYGGIDAYGTEADLRYNPQYGRNFKIGLSFNME